MKILLRFLFFSLSLLKVGWWEGVATGHARVCQRQTWMNAEVCLMVPMILMVISGKDHETPRPSLRKQWMWALGFLCFITVLKQSCLHTFNDKNERLPQTPNVCLYQEPLSHAPEFLLYQWQLRNHPISQLHRCQPTPLQTLSLWELPLPEQTQRPVLCYKAPLPDSFSPWP